jgi:hypothetical protein
MFNIISFAIEVVIYIEILIVNISQFTRAYDLRMQMNKDNSMLN